MPEMMTRTEILAVLRSQPNVKVAHRLFDANEYLYMGADGNVYDENGYLFEDWYSYAHDGMRMRSGDVWEKDWFIIQ